MGKYTPSTKYLHVQISPDLMRDVKVAAARNRMLLHEYVAAALSIVLAKADQPKKRGAA